HCRFDRGIRRLDAPSHPAKDVDFPIGVEPTLVKVLIQISAATRRHDDGTLTRHGHAVLTGAIARVRTRHIQLRPRIRSGYDARRASLAYASFGQTQIQV